MRKIWILFILVSFTSCMSYYDATQDPYKCPPFCVRFKRPIAFDQTSKEVRALIHAYIFINKKGKVKKTHISSITLMDQGKMLISWGNSGPKSYKEDSEYPDSLKPYISQIMDYLQDIDVSRSTECEYNEKVKRITKQEIFIAPEKEWQKRRLYYYKNYYYYYTEKK